MKTDLFSLFLLVLKVIFFADAKSDIARLFVIWIFSFE